MHVAVPTGKCSLAQIKIVAQAFKLGGFVYSLSQKKKISGEEPAKLIEWEEEVRQ